MAGDLVGVGDGGTVLSARVVDLRAVERRATTTRLDIGLDVDALPSGSPAEALDGAPNHVEGTSSISLVLDFDGDAGDASVSVFVLALAAAENLVGVTGWRCWNTLVELILSVTSVTVCEVNVSSISLTGDLAIALTSGTAASSTCGWPSVSRVSTAKVDAE